SLFPNYRKHRASGQAVCTINGIDHYLGPHGTKASKLEYDRLIMEWVASGRSSGYGKPAGCWSVSSLVLEYLDHAKKYYGTGSTSEYQRFRYVVRPLVDLYG